MADLIDRAALEIDAWDKATEHKPKPLSYTNKEFTVFIREGASLNGIPCTAVGMRYKYKGEIYGIEIPFSQLTLEDNDIAEACKELALCFLDSLKALEQQERRS